MRVQADNQILHQIVMAMIRPLCRPRVATSKPSPRPSRISTTRSQEGLNDLGAAEQQLADAVADAEDFRDQAAEAAQSGNTAGQCSQSADRPNRKSRNASGRPRRMRPAMSRLNPRASFTVCARTARNCWPESGHGTFVAKDYPVWFITLPGVDFSIGPNGHLHINI